MEHTIGARICGVITATVLLFGASVLPTQAVEPPSADADFSELLALNPGTTEAEMFDVIRTISAETGMNEQEVIAQGLEEGRRSVAAASHPATSSEGDTARPGRMRAYMLPRAQRPGDIFVAPASTLFVHHGHTGIYYTIGAVVEAPGAGKLSRAVARRQVPVESGTEIMAVNVSAASAKTAGDYAKNNLVGKPYSTQFVANKNTTAAKMNCSQLVWSAYKASVSVDLDGDGGLGVYPNDIKKSPRTSTYLTL